MFYYTKILLVIDSQASLIPRPHVKVKKGPGNETVSNEVSALDKQQNKNQACTLQYGDMTEYKASVSMTTDHSLETKFLLCWNIPVTVSSNDLQWRQTVQWRRTVMKGGVLASFPASLAHYQERIRTGD